MNVLDQLATDVLYAPEQDMWVRFEDDGTARVGATHLVSIAPPRPPFEHRAQAPFA